MENKLNLTLDITSAIDVGSTMSFFLLDKDNNQKFEIKQTFTEQRIQSNQIAIGKTIDETLLNFSKAMTLDYSNIFLSSKLKNGIFLEGTNRNIDFIGGTTFNPLTGNPFINYTPELIPVNLFSITSITFLPSTDSPCSKARIRIVTNQIMNSYCIDFNCNQYNSNTVELEGLRGITHEFKAVRNGITISRLINVPNSILNLSNSVSVSVNNSPYGSSAIVNVPSNELQLQYSLNNSNWQSNNTFSGLTDGTYIVYIKDYLNCTLTRNFTIQSNVNNPFNNEAFCYISKANSIRYAKRVNFDSNHKTDENTLSCETDVLIPYKQIQLFEGNDIIKTQFKSNYDINRAYVIVDDIENELVVSPKTNNLGLKDKRTALKYNLGNGKTGIYFTSGDILDYNTGVIIQSYILNGYLPEWATKGNYFSMDNTWFIIDDIYFDENKNSDVIVINNYFTGNDSSVIVAAEYNRENYNVYEFSIIMGIYIDKKIKVHVNLKNYDSLDESQHFLSEEIQIQEKCINTLEIRYKNTKNTDIVYSTGIEHLLRIPYDLNSGVDINSSENHKTDDKAILLDAKIYETNKFKFEPLTKELWRKLKIALSHDTLLIDSVGYIKEDDFETEGPLEQTNLYVLSVTMVKTGQVHTNVISNDNIILSDTNIPEIVGLITNNSDGFIQY